MNASPPQVNEMSSIQYRMYNFGVKIRAEVVCLLPRMGRNTQQREKQCKEQHKEHWMYLDGRPFDVRGLKQGE